MTVKPNFTVIQGLSAHFKGWCGWGYGTQRAGCKPSKIPYKSKAQPLKVSEPDTWLTFEEAAALHAGGHGDGVGVVMAGAIGNVVAVDVDGCLLADGSAKPEAAAHVEALLQGFGWVETSPSGTGLRAFGLGVLPDWAQGERKAQPWGEPVEVYIKTSFRYLTTTGCLYSGSAGEVRQIEPASFEQFLKLAGFDQEAKAAPANPPAAESVEIERTDAEVMKLLNIHNRRGKITRLLAGDTSDHGGDHSVADMALCCEIAYFTRDDAQIDAIFRESGLMRPKWDEYRGAKKYSVKTVTDALKRQDRNYDEDAEAKRQGTKAAAKRSEAQKAQEGFLAGGTGDLKTEKGAILKGVWAASELLIRDRRLIGTVFFDEFAGLPLKARTFRDSFGDRAAPDSLGWINDDDLLAVRAWLARQWKLDVNADDAKDILQRWARQCSRNPVIERLEECKSRWVNDGGRQRLRSWLADYCGARIEGSEGENIGQYVAEVGRRWLIQAAARAFNPGCQADSMLIFEGPQGARKSSAARVLCEAINDESFLEGFSLSGDTQQNISLKLMGTLVAEWGELAGMGKHEADAVKQFITQRTDTFRKPFDRLITSHKRTATFLASTNELQYLRDLTGNRRFWPITTGRIDIDRLREDAPLLWGEAVAEYLAGARYWIDEVGAEDATLSALTLAEQRRRLMPDCWDELALDLAEQHVRGELAPKLEALGHEGAGGPSLAALMQSAGMESVQADVSGQRGQRFARALRKSGWATYMSGGRSKWRLSDEALEAISRRLEIPKPKGGGMRKRPAK